MTNVLKSIQIIYKWQNNIQYAQSKQKKILVFTYHFVEAYCFIWTISNLNKRTRAYKTFHTTKTVSDHLIPTKNTWYQGWLRKQRCPIICPVLHATPGHGLKQRYSKHTRYIKHSNIIQHMLYILCKICTNTDHCETPWLFYTT